jgi:hypothetical protein
VPGWRWRAAMPESAAAAGEANGLRMAHGDGKTRAENDADCAFLAAEKRRWRCGCGGGESNLKRAQREHARLMLRMHRKRSAVGMRRGGIVISSGRGMTTRGYDCAQPTVERVAVGEKLVDEEGTHREASWGWLTLERPLAGADG